MEKKKIQRETEPFMYEIPQKNDTSGRESQVQAKVHVKITYNRASAHGRLTTRVLGHLKEIPPEGLAWNETVDLLKASECCP